MGNTIDDQYYDEWETFVDDNVYDKAVEVVAQKLAEHFPDTPLVAVLYMDTTMKMFGAFKNGMEAGEWYRTIPHGVKIVWQPLRNPHIKRDYGDFYLPERLENLEKEYDHTIKEN